MQVIRGVILRSCVWHSSTADLLRKYEWWTARATYLVESAFRLERGLGGSAGSGA